jgi:carbon monoxide dehydrogenase subunit G
MWWEMRRENLAFVDRAPIVRVSEAEVAGPRQAVFAALVDAHGWEEWFPSVREIAYVGPPPYGVGTIRRANVGGTWWIEEMIAWDEGRRWGWTVTRASVPFATALVETFELFDAGEKTRMRWTFALEPRLLGRLGAPFLGRSLRRVLGRATENLGAYLLRASAAPSAGAELK